MRRIEIPTRRGHDLHRDLLATRLRPARRATFSMPSVSRMAPGPSDPAGRTRAGGRLSPDIFEKSSTYSEGSSPSTSRWYQGPGIEIQIAGPSVGGWPSPPDHDERWSFHCRDGQHATGSQRASQRGEPRRRLASAPTPTWPCPRRTVRRTPHSLANTTVLLGTARFEVDRSIAVRVLRHDSEPMVVGPDSPSPRLPRHGVSPPVLHYSPGGMAEQPVE